MNNPQKTTKPVVPAMLADTDFMFKKAKEGSDQFLQAKPFPYIVLSPMIKPQCSNPLFEGLQQMATLNEQAMFAQVSWPAVVRMLVWELASSTLIRHFSSITGSPPLLPDPFFFKSGPVFWEETETSVLTDEEGHKRHPRTDLENAIRLELFVSCDGGSTCEVDFLGEENTVFTEIIKPCSVLITGKSYKMKYRFSNPLQWVSFVAYYYINDKARELNGEEQPRGGY